MTDQDLLDTATQLSSQFSLRGDEIETARRIPADISLDMAKAGFYRMGVPEALGGLEASPVISSKVIETLARGDASCGWVVFIGMTSFTSLSALPAATGKEVMSEPDCLMTGVFAPTAVAERVDGGFRVSGRWQWGSGSQNASWVLGGTLLQEGGSPMLDKAGKPRSHMAVMPASDIEYLDTWHVSGLCGTGSLDYQVEDLFVPDHRMVGFSRADRLPVTPLYRFPNFTLLSLGVGAVAMGIARTAISELLELAVSKKRFGSRSSIAEQQTSQIRLAQAEADLQSARLFFYDKLEAAWAVACENRHVDIERRRDLRLAITNAVRKSVGVVSEMYELGGGSAVYKNSRLQRCFRDINVAKSHIMVSQQVLQTVGSHYFQLEPNVSML